MARITTDARPLLRQIREWKEQGYIKAEVWYSGHEDSADAFTLALTRADGSTTEEKDLWTSGDCAQNGPWMNAFCGLFTPGGFEINEGGYGSVSFDLMEMVAESSHTFQEYGNENHEDAESCPNWQRDEGENGDDYGYCGCATEYVDGESTGDELDLITLVKDIGDLEALTPANE